MNEKNKYQEPVVKEQQEEITENFEIAFYPFLLGKIPRNLKTPIFEPKLSFSRENHKNYSSGEFPDFYEFTLFMIF